MNDSHNDFIDDRGDEDDDIEDNLDGLDPNRVFAMGEHAGGKAFQVEAIALLENKENRNRGLHFDEKADGLLEAINIIKNITT